MNTIFNRRTVLRGTIMGAAVTVPIPFLDCFLNGNGTALADGSAMPVRFGTWFWGLGMTKSIFVPKKTGGVRRISAPKPKLARAQHWVLEQILEKVATSNEAHGFVRGRSIVSNAKVHVGQRVETADGAGRQNQPHAMPLRGR